MPAVFSLNDFVWSFKTGLFWIVAEIIYITTFLHIEHTEVNSPKSWWFIL